MDHMRSPTRQPTQPPYAFGFRRLVAVAVRIEKMKRALPILMLILLPCASVWARWSVTHVSPTNASQQKLTFAVTSTVESNAIAFVVAVSGMTNYPLPEAYSADVMVSGGIRQKTEHSEPHTHQGITSVTYRFTVSTEQLDNATFCFWIPPPANSPYAHLGGHYFALDLKDFTKEMVTDSNKPSERTR